MRQKLFEQLQSLSLQLQIQCGEPRERRWRASALVRITDLSRTSREVRKVPKNGNGQLYSITSSARDSSVGGTARPRAFAEFTLIESSKRVGCKTGKSAGLSPFKIRPV